MRMWCVGESIYGRRNGKILSYIISSDVDGVVSKMVGGLVSEGGGEIKMKSTEI